MSIEGKAGRYVNVVSNLGFEANSVDRKKITDSSKVGKMLKFSGDGGRRGEMSNFDRLGSMESKSIGKDVSDLELLQGKSGIENTGDWRFNPNLIDMGGNVFTQTSPCSNRKYPERIFDAWNSEFTVAENNDGAGGGDKVMMESKK